MLPIQTTSLEGVSLRTQMSALGQKQTFAVQQFMSALPSKADICSANRNVRFGPKADINVYPTVSVTSSLGYAQTR